MKFNPQAAGMTVSPRRKYQQNYVTARYQIPVVVAFTMINLVLTLLNSGTRFLFSATVPTYVTEYVWVLTGHASPDYYPGGIPVSVMDSGYLPVALVISFVIIGLYVLCFFLAKKHPSFMIAAGALFAVDCAALLLIYSGSLKEIFFDVLFHVWVMYYFVSAIIAIVKLKRLPPDEPVAAVYADASEQSAVGAEPSKPTDAAEDEVPALGENENDGDENENE